MSVYEETYTFEMMREKVTFLSLALERAIAADKAEAESFWTGVKRIGEHGLLFAGAEKERFTAEGEALIAQANFQMWRIELRSDGRLHTNAPIPRQLLDDAQTWRDRALDVDVKIDQCLAQRNVPEWTGLAKNGYVEAVIVQESALRELKGVMESTAQSCYTGAVLNQAIFEAVAMAVIDARNRVEEFNSPGGSSYYLRTANAIPVLEALADQVDRATSGEVADGSTNILTVEVDSTVGVLPNLLVEGHWPTGTAAVAVSPADTAAGVSSDGSDANTDVEALIRYCLGGARL